MKRKDFVKGVCLLSAAGLLKNLLESCVNDHLVQPSIPLPSNQSQINSFNNNTTGGTNLTSSNSVNSTTSYFNHQIVCPSHSGYYDLNGKVTGAPPPRPLQKYSILLIGKTLYVS